MTSFQYAKYKSTNHLRLLPNLIDLYYEGKVNGKDQHFGNYFKKNSSIIGIIKNYYEKGILINQGNKNILIILFDHGGTSIGYIKGLNNRIFYK
jgi:hypothetical protein